MVKIDGDPWFVAADVCKALGYSHTPHALRTLDADEKNTVRLADGNRSNPNGTSINESGLYALILKSERPEAKPFKKWVTSTVLPAIRKDGAYIMGEEKVATGERHPGEAGQQRGTAGEFRRLLRQHHQHSCAHPEIRIPPHT